MWQDGKESNPGRGPHQKHSWATLRIQVGFGPAQVRGSSEKELGSLAGGWWGGAGGSRELQQPHLSRATLAAAACTRDSHCVTDQDDQREGRKGNNLCLPVGECL